MARGRGTVRTALPLLSLFALAGCTQGGLDPEGQGARSIFTATIALTVAGSAVTLLVIGLWYWGYRRRSDTDLETKRAESVGDSPIERRLVIGGGVVVPAVVLLGFFGYGIANMGAYPKEGEFIIEVVGHQFWWEVTYRELPGIDEPFETANQIHVPVDTEVEVVLFSDDVIHSFWVPQLAGKLDLVPGRENRFTFTALEPGVYPGYCAEFCGLQHAWMKFEVVAMAPDEFDRWVEQHAAPAPAPDTELEQRGREVFIAESCIGCHTIRGVADQGEFGPDLTHLATRTEIGAGILQLNEENLTAWIVNPQAIKPGNNMPPQELDEEDLQALVAYLLSLE